MARGLVAPASAGYSRLVIVESLIVGHKVTLM